MFLSLSLSLFQSFSLSVFLSCFLTFIFPSFVSCCKNHYYSALLKSTVIRTIQPIFLFISVTFSVIFSLFRYNHSLWVLSLLSSPLLSFTNKWPFYVKTSPLCPILHVLASKYDMNIRPLRAVPKHHNESNKERDPN